MGTYLHKFANETERNAYLVSSEFREPFVSAHSGETGDIPTYSHETSTIVEEAKYNGHDYVEIAGLKWATMNVGATAITDYGKYFQWGDISGYTSTQVGSGTGQKYFGWADYKYGNGSSEPTASNMTKYNSTDGKTVLDLSDDGVRANWGGAWRMPTYAEFTALGAATTTAWTTNYKNTGVVGLVLTDKTDASNELFFPAAGYAYNGGMGNVGGYGCYWYSSLYSSNVLNGRYLLFYGAVYWQYYYVRRYGFSLRGVVNL